MAYKGGMAQFKSNSYAVVFESSLKVILVVSKRYRFDFH